MPSIEMVGAVVATLVAIAIAVFIFSNILPSIQTAMEQSINTNNTSPHNITGATTSTNSIDFIWQILPMIMIVGVTGIILGVVYNYSRYGSYESFEPTETETTKRIVLPPGVPQTVGDFTAVKVSSSTSAIKQSYALRKEGYWTKVIHDNNNDQWITYRSTWKQNQHDRGTPKWKRRNN